MSIHFEVLQKATTSRARRGRLKTLHSHFETPVFMPVGTHASVRGVSLDDVNALGFKMLLTNTYHLLLRPGVEFFKSFGDVRKFSNWPHAFLTDSGGFQIFSLPQARSITEEGARFRSYIDGTFINLTPETSIGAQEAIGSDIMMVLDECIPSTSPKEEAKRAMDLTHRWALRSLNARTDSTRGVFAIVQGACFKELREESARFLTQHSFDGFAVGGLAVGESRREREDMTEIVTELLPHNRPRYLMGVGTPLDLLEAVHRGIDMFDCVLPTLLGQQGVAYIKTGKIDLRKGKYKCIDEPLDKTCECSTCAHMTRSYLHHLIKAQDPHGGRAISLHNLFFYASLMSDIRHHIQTEDFFTFYESKKAELASGEEDEMEESPRKTTIGKYEIFERAIKDSELQRKRFISSVRHTESGEVMHSSEDPIRESNRLYIQQSRLRDRATKEDSLIIWDVGLGAATNAMGVVHAIEDILKVNPSAKIAKIQLCSFEIDLDPLRLAIHNKKVFPHLNHPAPEELLNHFRWDAPYGLTWQLYEGDFLKLLTNVPAPDLVFFDPFSYKVDSDLWTLKSFETLFRAMSSDAALFTYSASTAVRAALLAAGFTVGYGLSTGQKKDTTAAFTGEAWRQYPEIELLGDRWRSRWEKSHNKFPYDVDEISQGVFSERIFCSHQYSKDRTLIKETCASQKF